MRQPPIYTAKSAVIPRDIALQQRGIVTRYGRLDKFSQAALLTVALQQPSVLSWQAAHSLTDDDMAALLTALLTTPLQ
jgi:hypothetical protein